MSALLIATIAAASVTLYAGIYHFAPVPLAAGPLRSGLCRNLPGSQLIRRICVVLYEIGSGTSGGGWQLIRWGLLCAFGGLYGWFIADLGGLLSYKRTYSRLGASDKISASHQLC